MWRLRVRFNYQEAKRVPLWSLRVMASVWVARTACLATASNQMNWHEIIRVLFLATVIVAAGIVLDSHLGSQGFQ
jgi:hypothetical protein